MRLRKLLRRIAGVAALVVYAAAVVWVLAPLWDTSTPGNRHPSVRPVSFGAEIGIARPGPLKAIPTQLPGSEVNSSAAEIASGTESTGGEEASGTSETSEYVPEAGETPAPSGGGGNGGSSGTTILGFEG